MLKNQSKPRKIIVPALIMTLLLVTGAYVAKPMSFENEKTSPPINPPNQSERITDAQTSTEILPDTVKELNISLNVDNGGVEIIPASTNQVTASYDSQYYDVQMELQNDWWVVSVSGKVEKMGHTGDVQLQIPAIKSQMNVNVLDGDFSYHLPEDCKNEVNVTAKDGGVHFVSSNHFDNSRISLVAQDKNFILYEPPTYPDYFTRTENGFEYKNGTEATKISITLAGYTSVEFEDETALIK